MIPFFILAVLLIAAYEGPQLIKNKLWRELGVMGVIVGATAYLAVAGVLGMSTPLNWLEKLLGPVGMIIFK